jgi:hypothetical protein
LRELREGSAAGRLSIDTFSVRVERVLGARSRAELDELVADVRPAGRVRRGAMRAIAWFSALSADLQGAWTGPRVPALALPARLAAPVTIGRSRDCDCVLAEASVSRRHAELRRDGGRWLLRDLGSRNGTRVNGLRVLEEIEIRPGDRVSFGGAPYRFTGPAPAPAPR